MSYINVRALKELGFARNSKEVLKDLQCDKCIMAKATSYTNYSVS